MSPAFVRTLREVTKERGILLIFDEVISGFRCAPGGAQEVLGILPDLTALGKIVAAVHPAGDLAGREEILGVHTRGKPLAADVDLRSIARVLAHRLI